MKQVGTLAIIENGNMVLLAMKKRGFGEGWWNGFGGKVQDDESIPDAMARELWEESGLIAKEYRERVVIEFIFKGTDKIHEVHVFEVTGYEGVPTESEEMKPEWFDKKDVPYDQMWPADREWFPLFFDGKNFEGKAVFDGETKAYIESDFRVQSSSEGRDNRKVHGLEKNS